MRSALALPQNRIIPAKSSFQTSMKLSRIARHLVKGGLRSPLSGAFNHLSGQAGKHLLEMPYYQRWINEFVDMLNMDIKVCGARVPDRGCLFVANHISWVDAVALSAVDRFSFIAKQEVKSWPIIGGIGRQFNTVFIERHNKFSVYRSLPALSDYMNAGNDVLVFPEGTTSDGQDVLHFYPMLFEAAVRAGCPIQPIALRYTDDTGKYLPEVSFIDDDTVIDTLVRMLAQKKVQAHLSYLEPLTYSTCRKVAATVARQRISQALESED